MDETVGTTATERLLGAGRSGQVYLEKDPDGTAVAVKRFGSESVTKLVQYVLLGAPNPYLWSRDAVECALHRRRILAVLLEYWFGDKVALSAGLGVDRNEQHRALELRCAFVEGHHLPLRHPFADRTEELGDLRYHVMAPLQRRLMESGFDGLVWQAGHGNPVALNNFLRDNADATDGSPRWVWIDLESGIPALVPLNPITLFRFYLPRSIRHGAPLFDDVDLPRLNDYVHEHVSAIGAQLGDPAVAALHEGLQELEEHQLAWKSLGRIPSAIRYALSQGKITAEEATRYEARPGTWIARMVRRGFASGWRAAGRAVAKLGRWVASIDVLTMLRNCGWFLVSQAFRARIARHHIDRRVARWAERGQLKPAEVTLLHDQLQEEGTSAYLTDFGVHLAVKPFVKAVQWWLLPALLLMGVIDERIFVLAVAGGGAALRTLYTLWRLAQSTALGQERPWIALATGVLPVIGNAAYPLQILYSGNAEQSRVAQFIIYDTFTLVGQRLPIWGGPDTLTEHVTNRVGDLVTAWSRRRRAPVSDPPATVHAGSEAFGPQRASSAPGPAAAKGSPAPKPTDRPGA